MKLFPSQLSRRARLVVSVMIAAGAAIGVSMPAMARLHGGPGEAGAFRVSAMEFNERMLDSVGASAEQKAQIKSIFKAARADLVAQRASATPLLAPALQNFASTTVDANAAESLRQQMAAQRDAAGRRMVQANVAAANVLTPTQRQSIAAKITQRLALAQQQRAERAALYQPAR